MRSVYVNQLGGADPLANLQLGEREPVEPRAGWALVRMRAASLNHHDLWTLQGVGAKPDSLPRTLGCDLAGTVEGYGPGDWRPFPEGAAVVAHSVITCGHCPACLGPDQTSCRDFAMLSEGPYEGTLAELCQVPVGNLFPLPQQWDFQQAACLPTAYLTAYRMLFVKAELRPGDSVLIQGAGGGLSTAAETLGIAAGLRVMVSSRSPEKCLAALGRGAHLAVATGRQAVSEVMAATEGMGVDAVIESVGEATWTTSLRVLRRGGAVVVAGATTGSEPPADLRRVFWRQLRILGSTMGTRDEFRSLLGMVAAARVSPVIDSVHLLSDAEKAFARLASGAALGKVVVTTEG